MDKLGIFSRSGRWSALLGLGLLSTACGGEKAKQEGGALEVVAELKSDAPRVTPDVAEATSAAQSEQAFGFAFLQKLGGESNLAFSPHSLSTAFAMLTDAAQGQTLTEVQQVLAFGSTDEAFHRSQDALELGLAARNRAAISEEDRKVEAQILTESNDIWIRDDVPPKPSYLDTLARYYGVGVHQADFPKHPDESRLAINAKVSTDTHDLIPELIPENEITADTVSVLTNAMYFKAPWENQFAEPAAGDFHRLDGSTASAQLMKGGGTFDYYAGEGFVAVAVPYFGGDLEMLLLVPDAGSYQAVRSQLSSAELSRVVAERRPELVELTMPTFDVKSTVPAAETLQQLGMLTPFDAEKAQFPGFPSAQHDNIYVSDVLHQATVAVDEKGTEASAATAIIITGTSSAIIDPPTPKIVTVDRPFLFVIRDNPTGAVLFVGQVVAP
jgi:serpin B